MLPKATISPVTRPWCLQSFNRQIEFKTIKIQKSGGWGSGSYLWKRWRHGARPSAHWSLGSREQSSTVPGGRGPSTDRPTAWWTNLQYHTRSVFFLLILINSLQGQKEKKKSSESSFNSMAQIQPAPFKCGFMMALISRHQKLMSLWDSGDADPEIISRSWGASQNRWVQMKRGQALRDVCRLPFGKNDVCFSKSVPVWQTDEKIRLTPEGEKRFF